MSSREVRTLDDARQAVIEQMAQTGITGLAAHELQLGTSKPVAFVNTSEKGNSKKGWYWLSEYSYTDAKGDRVELISGAFGDWRLQNGPKENGGWRVEMSAPGMSAEERKRLAEHRKQQAAQAKKMKLDRQSTAARRGLSLWRKLGADQGQDLINRAEYLQKKQVPGLGVRVTAKGSVVIPMRDVKCKIWGVQIIRPAALAAQQNRPGKEFFPAGLKMEGTYHHIGPEPSYGDVVVVVEGYATGASVHLATGYTVIVAFNTAKLATVAKAVKAKWPGRKFVMGADDDAHVVAKRPADMPPIDNAGIKKATEAAEQFDPPWAVVLPDFSGLARSSGDEAGKGGDVDFNDLHVLAGEQGLERIRESFHKALNPESESERPAEDWVHQLSRDEKGQIKATLGNVTAILSNDRRWRGVIGWDEMRGQVMKRRKTPLDDNRPGGWSDGDTTGLRVWLEKHWGVAPNKQDVDSAVEYVAELNSFHELRDWLNGLEWDGKRRLAGFFAHVTGSTDDDPTYLALVGKYFFTGMVARVLATQVKPQLATVKMDNMVILEGAQGLLKSTLFRELVGANYFSDAQTNLSDQKQAAEVIKGKWVVEMPEMDAFYKAETTAAKAFLTQQSDRYRPAYARNAVEVPRVAVFVGTVNAEVYLKDVENRRYWPIACKHIDIEYAAQNKDQLWAEAVALYREDQRWWPSTDELPLFSTEQDKRREVDTWQEVIEGWQAKTQIRGTQGKPSRKGGLSQELWSICDIMIHAFDIDPNMQRQQDQRRVKAAIEALGWRSVRRRSGNPYGENKRAWLRPAIETNSEDSAGFVTGDNHGFD